MPLNRQPIVRRLTPIWILLLVAGSLQPARLALLGGLHRPLHWLVFSGTAFLLLLAARNLRQELCGVAAACLLGLSLECLQHLIYRNPMEWRDVRDDGLAVLLALALYRLAVTGRAALLAKCSAASAASRDREFAPAAAKP